MKHYAFGGLPLVLPVTSCCILYVLNLNLGEFVGIHLIIQQHQVRLISLYSFVYQNVISVQTFNGASISNLLLVWHNSHKLWMNYVHIFWCSLVLPGAAKQLPKALSFFGLILTIHPLFLYPIPYIFFKEGHPIGHNNYPQITFLHHHIFQ